jgi:hypothetical protein
MTLLMGRVLQGESQPVAPPVGTIESRKAHGYLHRGFGQGESTPRSGRTPPAPRLLICGGAINPPRCLVGSPLRRRLIAIGQTVHLEGVAGDGIAPRDRLPRRIIGDATFPSNSPPSPIRLAGAMDDASAGSLGCARIRVTTTATSRSADIGARRSRRPA